MILHVASTPQALLEPTGVFLVEPEEADQCCGFGGIYSMTEPAVSTADAKWEAVRRGAEAYNAPALTGADLGCLLHLAGRLSRQGGSFPVLHLAELLDLSARDLQFRTSQWLLGKVETDLERWALRGDNG